MTKVLMLIKTTGLEFDDRVRKECLSLLSLGAEPVVGVLDDSNLGRSGKTDYGVRFRSVSLRSRRVFSSARGLPVKTAELIAKFVGIILSERPDVLWLHDFTTMGMVPIALVFRRMGLIKRIVWDQHELPPESWINSGRTKGVLGKLMCRCDAIVAANKERLEMLEERLEHDDWAPHGFVLRNYPDEDFCSLPKGSLPDDVQKWLGGHPYLMTQGGGDDDRRLAECVEAVIESNGLVKLIVVGRYRDEMVGALKQRWGSKFGGNVYFTGMVPQMKVVDYLDNAGGSIVLYRRETQNSWLCAPNRLYQAISRGVPVVVGCNPPLKDLVGRLGAGVVLKSDGEDVADLGMGIQKLMEGRAEFAAKAEENRNTHLWGGQNKTVGELLGDYQDENN